MSELAIPSNLALPIQVRKYIDNICVRLSSSDGMYKGNDRHYLSCGASALNAILSSLNMAAVSSPSEVLDFGSGTGRVTRWLRAAFPEAKIEVCDLPGTDFEFCRKAFDVEEWVSGTDIESLCPPRNDDLIWAGSVITHLDSRKTEKLINKMLSWLNPGGVFVFSTHGRFVASRIRSVRYGISDEGIEVICSEYKRNSFGYANYPRRDGYGISITGMRWMLEFIENRTDCRLIGFAGTHPA